MKMRKKLIKKVNFLNPGIYIKNYFNFLIFSYLNNFNLKYFFYLLKKKLYSIKNKVVFKLFFKKYIYLKYATLKKKIKYQFKGKFKINSKNKFFNNVVFNSLAININKLPVYLVNDNNLNSISLISSNNKFSLINNLEIINLIKYAYIEIITLMLFYNLVKLSLIYKNLINLTILNIIKI